MSTYRNRVGIRAEDKNRWERRVPLVPKDVAALVGDGVDVVVQASPTRIFPDADFSAAGAQLSPDLGDCGVVIAVKEIPAREVVPGTAYLFFSHTIKGQAHNMGLLRKFLDSSATLIDYEPIVDSAGVRLVAFGRYAGLAGMIDALWAYGQRCRGRGWPNPVTGLRPAHTYPDLSAALAAVHQVGLAISGQAPPEAAHPDHAGSTAPHEHTGLADRAAAQAPPIVIGVTGGGKVASGALEVLGQLPVVEIDPDDLLGPGRPVSGDAAGGAQALVPGTIYLARFAERHTVQPADGGTFDLSRYRADPAAFRSAFAPYLPHLDILVNAITWDHRAPRLVTREDLRALGPTPRLTLIADLSCDIDGGIEATVRATDPDDPVFCYDPHSGLVVPGFAGAGIAVLAVDNLPCELPRAASEGFSAAVRPFIPVLAQADFREPFAELDLPTPLKDAVIAHGGQLTPRYDYLRAYLG